MKKNKKRISIVMLGIISAIILVLAEIPETLVHVYLLIPQEFKDKLVTIEGITGVIVGVVITSSIAKIIKMIYFKGNSLVLTDEEETENKEDNKEEEN